MFPFSDALLISWLTPLMVTPLKGDGCMLLILPAEFMPCWTPCSHWAGYGVKCLIHSAGEEMSSNRGKSANIGYDNMVT